MSLAKAAASGFNWYESVFATCPANFPSLDFNSQLCFFVNLRHSTFSSIWIRAIRSSSSASLRNCAVSCVTIAIKWSLFSLNAAFFVRNWPLIRETTIPMASSPKTPNTTKDVAIIPSKSFLTDGWSGGRTMPRRHAARSSRWSKKSTQISAATPMTTIVVNHGSNPSQNDDESSRVFISLQCRERTLQSGYGTFQGGSIGRQSRKGRNEMLGDHADYAAAILARPFALTLLRFRGRRASMGLRGQSIAPVSSPGAQSPRRCPAQLR